MRHTTFWMSGVCSVALVCAATIAHAGTIAYARFDNDLGVSAGGTPGAAAIVDETGGHVSTLGVTTGAPTTNGADLRWSTVVAGSTVPQTGESNSFSLTNGGTTNPFDGFEMPGADFARGMGMWTIEYFAMLDPAQSDKGITVGFFGFNRVAARISATDELLSLMNIFIDNGTDVLNHTYPLGPIDGLWHHYAWVHPSNSGQVDMYYDGQLVSSPVAAFVVNVNLGSNPRMAAILADSPSMSAIDEIRVSDTALQPGQLLVAAVPEPSSIALALLGFAGLLALGYWQRGTCRSLCARSRKAPAS